MFSLCSLCVLSVCSLCVLSVFSLCCILIENPTRHSSVIFLRCFEVCLERRSNINALPVPLLRQVYFQCFLGVFFECVFRGVPRGVFFDIGCLWVSLWGSLLTPFCEKLRFFWKRWYPRFGTTVQRFGLILGVLSPSEAIQIRKKGSRNSFEI